MYQKHVTNDSFQYKVSRQHITSTSHINTTMAEQKIEDLPIVKSLLEHDLPAPSEQQKQVVSQFMLNILHSQREKAVIFASISCKLRPKANHDTRSKNGRTERRR